MPKQGIEYVPRTDLMTFEEMARLVDIAVDLGIEKVRITGGEPFLRKDMMALLEMIASSGLKEIHLTTNGTLTYERIPQLKKIGISSINLSLDSLDKDRFYHITRRDEFDKVYHTFHRLLEFDIPTKINMVVMEGRNEQDVIPMAYLAEKHPVSVRFIEEMPFNGSGKNIASMAWNHLKILEYLTREFPSIRKKETQIGATATSYKVHGFMGNLGIIAAYSRTFCGTCNRLRVTPSGAVRTCLYDEGVFNIRDLMREGASDMQVRDAITQAIGQRALNGFEAEARRFNFVSESMSTIGG